ncbi:hypothetical protein DICSQDRAFT_123228 [Dichomitus squalens LYAD-421 SS1]|uniref:uncharacterized protein n=1 Tax=Dichomitus squalens (strain LYAD-421) TaxID=732165 RepID=UPI0004411C6B|nr:uncharacterized protein DICSQDRAFT_123228 [Dichomitus squalens LYAD-421 SS1]EJF66606.1 hypothetical protein DICSQDRAFT_123228 [Dichomitus squalens LYAD-421 SS1]
MDGFTAFVSWPSAPLTNRLVLDALRPLTPTPTVWDFLSKDTVSSPVRLLQWATYDALDHDLTCSHDPASRVLSSSYVIRKALIRKHYLSRCIHNYLTKHPDSVLTRSVPRTWELELSFADELDELWSDDLYDLSEQVEKGDPSKWWILKPGMADRGMGLRLFHTKEDLEAIFQEFEQADSDEDDEEGRGEEGHDTAVVTSQLRHFVIQEYISNPLLLDPAEAPLDDALKPARSDLRGHKFHLRVYCVASGAIKVYVYERILALFSAVPYVPPKSVDGEQGTPSIDLAPHLTNTSLQTERGEAGVRLLDELVGCHILSGGSSAAPPRQPQRPPRATGQALDPEAINAARKSHARHATLTKEDVEDLKGQISNVLAETFKAAIEMSVHFQCQPLPNAFELFGVDFVVAHDSSPGALRKFQVKLLEVNSEPAIELTGPRLTWVLEDLFKGIAKTCVEPYFSAEGSPAHAVTDAWKVGETKQELRMCLDQQIRSACRSAFVQDCQMGRFGKSLNTASATSKMSTNTSNILFDDIFSINDIDKEGKKFDRVSRLYAHSKNYDMDLTLDYNTELFPIQSGQSIALALASSLSRNPQGAAGTTEDEDKDRDVWRPDAKGRRGLDDDYEYVMYGKVYRFDSGSGEVVTAYASFGGLLMSLTGSFRHLTSIVLGDPVFILLRR